MRSLNNFSYFVLTILWKKRVNLHKEGPVLKGGTKDIVSSYG